MRGVLEPLLLNVIGELVAVAVPLRVVDVELVVLVTTPFVILAVVTTLVALVVE